MPSSPEADREELAHRLFVIYDEDVPHGCTIAHKAAIIGCLSRRLTQLLVERGGLVTLAALVLYLGTAPPHIVFGDNAELCTLGSIGGVAHPSGYPLYLLWLRAWSWLPVSPAHSAAMATAILGALSVLVLHAGARAWGARPFAATVAVGLFAVGPIVLRLNTEAEVFAPNNLVCATVVWLAAKRGPLVGARRAIGLGLVAGLGLSHHLTCVLVAPIGLLGAVRGIRECEARRLLVGAGAVLALVIGLLPYAYLLVTPETVASWGSIDDLSQLFRHVVRADYGSFQLSDRYGAPNVALNYAVLARMIGRSYLYLPAVGGLVTLAACVVRGDRGERRETRIAWGMFAASWVLAGPVFASRLNVEPVAMNLYVVQRFFLLAVTLLAIPIAVGLDRSAEWLAPSLPERLRSSVALRVGLVVAGLGTAVLPSLAYKARVHSAALERGLENMLETLPVGAVVIGSTDDFHFGLGYLQATRAERLDVGVITTPQLGLQFARERVRERIGITVERIPEGSDEKLSVKIAKQVLATGRPLFIDPYQQNIAKALPSYPYGILFRILPPGTRPPPIEEVFAINKALFERFRFDYPLPGPDDQLATQYHQHYARTWQIIAAALSRGGDPEHLAYAIAMAEALAPTERP